jgi:hypothetical protein
VLALKVEVVDIEADVGFPVADVNAVPVVVVFGVEEDALDEVVLCVPASPTELEVLPTSLPPSATISAQLTYVTPGHAAVHS